MGRNDGSGDGMSFRGALAQLIDPRPVLKAEVVPAKAATGPGVAMFGYGNPLLTDLSRSPQRLMRRAQMAYHTNPWVRTAEATVTRRVTGLDWHLEDAEDEEINDPQGDVLALRTLLERPQANLPNRRQMTRRELVSITSRHMGLCGMAYWYLDGKGLAGQVSAIIYVNPARVWPSQDARGNLVGWVLDPQDEYGNGGIPLSLQELLPFYLEPPDWGHIGTGLFEAASLKAQITNLADQHAAYVLGTGGRIAGIVSPKEGTIPPESFAKLVAEFRNVNEAPDAAKRTTILDGPIDFTPTAADPSELNLIQLSTMNRDDILAIWGVPPSQAGIPQSSGGLNSGETRKYDEATLMQGAVHDRVAGIYETIQYGLLDPWFGGAVELVIEEPEFDDRAPLYEMASKAINVPMKNAERRELVGLEPFGDDRDEEVFLPATFTLVYDAAGKAPEAPAPLPGDSFAGEPPAPPEMDQGMEMDAMPAKSKPTRRMVDERMVPQLRRQVADLLRAQLAEVAAKLRSVDDATWRRHAKQARYWWADAKETARLARVLRPQAAAISQIVHRDLVSSQGKAGLESVTTRILERAGRRITGINATTRDAVAEAIAQGYADGLTAQEMADALERLPAFDEARAELIARTESALAYNEAALASYEDLGVTQVEALDGDEDPECAERNGNVYSIEEAMDITDHPNGTLDWAPVVA